MGEWTLANPRQCGNCPWKKGANLASIPGYDPDYHESLAVTIADLSDPLSSIGGDLKVMACHAASEELCIGWLVNQAGRGNNIGLRLKLRHCTNARDIETVGPQHECFEDTFGDPAAGLD